VVIQHDEAFTTGTLTYCGTEGEKKSISFSCTGREEIYFFLVPWETKEAPERVDGFGRV